MKTPTGFPVSSWLALGFSLVVLTGCAGKGPTPYTQLASASQLQTNTQKDADRTPYVYSVSADWRSYSAMLIEPVAIYAGADHQFGNLEEADKRELAQYMATTFNQVMARRFSLSNPAGRGTLRLRLTLTGAETNTAVVSTFTRFDLVGLPYNAVQGMRGKEGLFMGSVSYSVEIYDASNNRLLMAFVTKQHPNAMNVAVTFGSLRAAKTGLDKGAEELLVRLR